MPRRYRSRSKRRVSRKTRRKIKRKYRRTKRSTRRKTRRTRRTRGGAAAAAAAEAAAEAEAAAAAEATLLNLFTTRIKMLKMYDIRANVNKEMVKSRLEMLTVEELRKECASNWLNVTGEKQDLVERLLTKLLPILTPKEQHKKDKESGWVLG